MFYPVFMLVINIYFKELYVYITLDQWHIDFDECAIVVGWEATTGY